MDQRLPPIHSRGPGVKRSFAATLKQLEVGEQVEAFFYLAMSSSVAVTDRRTIVTKSGKDPITLPHISQLEFEKRGLLSRKFLKGAGQEAEIDLSDGDIQSINALIAGSQPSSGRSDQGEDDSDAEGQPSGLIGGLSTWIKETEEFQKPVREALHAGERLLFFGSRALIMGENASIFITSARIGVANKFSIIAQFKLSSVAETTFTKSMGKQRALLKLTDGREYKLGKVAPQEEPIAVKVLDAAIQGDREGEQGVHEFAALDEDEVVLIHARSLVNRFGDNNREIADKGQGTIRSAIVYKTAIRQGNIVRAIDGDVSAECQSGGGVQVTHRPTLTRMAAGSILPGTALIPGLAFQKKKTVDSRSTYFVCVHPEWMLEVNVDPDYSGDAIRAAKYINKQAGALQASPSPAPAPEPAHSGTEKSVAEQLREMKSLLDEDVITQEDFDKFKSSLLG